MFLVEGNLEPRLPCRELREARAAETEIWRDCQRSSTVLQEKLEFLILGDDLGTALVYLDRDEILTSAVLRPPGL
jgi:inosine-uridine nucleoside N-ribohydrolase